IEFMDVGSTNGWNFEQVITKEQLIDELLLTLKTSKEIDYSQFETIELDRLYSLFQLIQKSNKKITELEIEDHNGKSIGLPSDVHK
ncbi:hypothetical protein ACT453_42100, partial [Bacillus sp. D-CC]